MKEEYSPYKAVHHQDRLDQMRQGQQPNPLHVQIVVTNRCNHNCELCAYRSKSYNSSQLFDIHDEIPYEKVLEILDSCAAIDVKALQFTGGGEPLMHPRIDDIFGHVLESGMDFCLVSNGTLMTDRMKEMLSLAAWVRISMEAATPETYSRYRKAPKEHFDVACRNIGDLAKKKEGMTLGVGFVINRANYHEIYQAAKMAKDLGADNFRISAAFQSDRLGHFIGFFDEAKGESARAVDELSDKDFTVFNMFNDRIGDMFIGRQGYGYCPIKELQTYIGANQGVYVCCMWGYNRQGFIGSLKQATFHHLWKSKEKREWFRSHNPIRDCPVPCMYQGKNEFMNYCLKNSPRHVNFI